MMAGPRITVIDYGMGNIWSVLSACRYLGNNPIVSSDPGEVARAEAILLPGVGSFRKAMARLGEFGLDKAIVEAVRGRECKILGICLGMQLMGSHGSEDGDTPGLGLIPAMVAEFTPKEVGANKIPHIGFDSVRIAPRTRLFAGLPEVADFYFVHSYRMLPGELRGEISTCAYGVEFLAAYEQGNIYATQFHPEKSQTNGLQLLKNFMAQ
jgi:glutamine amidotransferase